MTKIFSVDSPEQSNGFLLWQTTSLWQRQIKKALEPYGVSHAQFVLLAILLWWDGKKIKLTQVDLVAHSKLDKMTISQALKKLVTLKLVKREEHPEDTRAKLVSLTSQGKNFARKLIPVVEKVDHEFFLTLSKVDQKNLQRAFSHLIGSKAY